MRNLRKWNTLRGLISLRSILICLPLVLSASNGVAQELARQLPPDVRQFVAIRDPETLRSQWDKTSLGIGWNSPAMASFHKARGEDTDGAMFLAWEALAKCAPSELVWAELSVDEKQPEDFAESVAMASFPRELMPTAVFKKLRPLLSQAGFEFVTRVEKSPPVIELRDANQRVLYLGNFGHQWGVADSTKTLTQVLSSEPQAETLSTQEAFASGVRKLSPLGEQPWLLWYVDSRWIQSQESPPGENDSEEDVLRTLWRQSRSSIRGITVITHLDEDSENWVSDLYISKNDRPSGILGLARFTSPSQTEMPSLAEGASATFAAHWDTSSALVGLGSIFDQIYADGIEGTFEDVLIDLKETEEINIDLPAAVAKLGPHARMNLKVTPEASEWALSVVAADPPETADIVTRLFDGDPQMRPLENLATGHGWQLKAEGDPLDGSVLRIAGDQLTFASSSHALAVLLPESKSEEGTDPKPRTDELKPAFAGILQLSDFLGPWWDDQRKAAVARPAEDSFSKLPPFAQVAEYFGLITVQIEDQTDGWLVRAIHLSAGEDRE